jgi:hypothetical protein
MLLLTDSDLALLVNTLGVAIFALIVAYHYLEARLPVKEVDDTKKSA